MLVRRKLIICIIKIKNKNYGRVLERLINESDELVEKNK